MNKITLLLLTGFLIITCGAMSQNKNKDFYLIDSLDTATLSAEDKRMIDSCLTLYHNTKDEYRKIQHLEYMVENCWDDNVWPRYNDWIYRKVDSMLKAKSKIPADSLNKSKAKAISNKGYFEMTNNRLEQAEGLFNQSLKMQQAIGDNSGIIASYNNLILIYETNGDLEKAIQTAYKSLKISKKQNNTEQILGSYNKLGILYYKQSNAPKALEYYQKCLELAEKIGDTVKVAYELNNIGMIHLAQKNFKLAYDYLSKCLVMQQQLNDKKGLGLTYNNLGLIFQDNNDYPQALNYYQKSLQLRKELNNKNGIAYCLNHIGTVYTKMDSFDVAKKYLTEALEIRKKIGDNDGIAYTYNNLGILNLKIKKYKEAKEYATSGLELSQKLGSPEAIKRNARVLSEIARIQNDYKTAYNMFKLEQQMTDSINSKEAIRAAAGQEAKYNYDKQRALDKVELEKQKAIEQKEKDKQQLIIYSVLAVLTLIIIFSLIIFRRLQITRRQKNIIEKQSKELTEVNEELNQTNEEIASQRDHIEGQRKVLENKNTEITESIHYAKRLQEAILPSFGLINEHFSKNFILFRPKDVVSGDFYWFEKADKYMFMAAADCTGHGIPGALVSVVCANALNRCVLEFNIYEPAAILNKTRELVVETFSKRGEEVKDGMDISLLRYEKDKQEITWAGANNPLYVFRKNTTQIEVIKPHKEPIGYSRDYTPYVNHTLKTEQGDTMYMFTDGYADQFGGNENKKIGYKRLRELFERNSEKTMQQQKEQLEEYFEQWKHAGDEEQMDDVCVIGLKF